MNKLVAIGELLIDFQSIGHSELIATNEFSKKPGGAPANVAVQVSKFKKPTLYIGKVGDDVFGQFLINTLKSEGVDISQIIKDKKHSTPLAFVSIKQNGEREFTFFRKNSADLFLSENEVDANLLEKGDIFHFGSVALSSSMARKAHKSLIKYCLKNNILISFDPNLRFNLWDNLNQLKKVVNEFLKFATIVKISDDELNFITDEKEEELAIKKIFKNKNIKVLLLSRGSKGASIYLKNGKFFSSPGYKVNTIDTTGAGDSFLGAVLSSLLGKENILELDYNEIIDLACKTGAYTTTKYGAISAMGTKEEILNFFKKEEY